MKLLIWKIIALTSVFMGSLGPQVAAGSPVEMQAMPEVQQKAELIPVVTAASDVKVVVQDTVDGCAASALQLGRFDLLLWSDCEASLAIGTVDMNQDVAVTTQQSWPKLSVTTGPYQSIASTYDVWSSSDIAVAGFVSLVNLETKTRNSLNVRQLSLGAPIVAQASFNSDNSQQTVVLRC